MRGSKNFRQGWGGGPRQSDKKALFFGVFFLSPWLFYRSQMVNLFFKVLEGVEIFPGGPTFSRGGGGSNCLFPIETQIT